MKRMTLVLLAATASALSLQTMTRAADAKGSVPPAAGDRVAALRQRMQGTARELNLTVEQKQKLQIIVREQTEKLRDLRQDNSLSRQERMERLKAAREEITSEVKKVLTPEQFEKWKARQGHLGGGTGSPGGPGARLQEAIKELNLTEAQKEQLKPLYEEQMEKLGDLRQDNSLSTAEKLEKLKALRKDIAPRVKKVLDAEQYARWERDTDLWLEQLKQRLRGQKQN